MKKIFMFILLCYCLSGNTQSDTLTWFIDQTQAKSHASNYDKEILMVFAGSDWCRPCIKFKNDILNNSIFKDFSKDKLVILYLDFPSKKKNKLNKEETMHNEILAEKYNISGSFPKIILFDKDLNKIIELNYAGQNVDEFIQQML